MPTVNVEDPVAGQAAWVLHAQLKLAITRTPDGKVVSYTGTAEDLIKVDALAESFKKATEAGQVLERQSPYMFKEK